ncbi:hypothetical protein [Streptomyces sp. NPDC059928]|uniref:hypothetical protein n=1 Tax=unclassified Streptomyces TaxID=2593676 RepID=UPI003650555A
MRIWDELLDDVHNAAVRHWRRPGPVPLPGVVVLERYLIRPATLDDDPEPVRALLEPVDFMDAAMPGEIVDRMRTGWQLPPQFGTATLLLAQEHPDGEVVGLAHAIPPVQWLMEIEAGLGRQLCLGLSRSLVELEAVSVAAGAGAGARGRGLGHRLVDELVRSYSSAGRRITTRPVRPGSGWRRLA